MNLGKISLFIVGFSILAASCGTGKNNDGNQMDTADYDQQTMPRDSVYPLDTTDMETDTM